MNKISVFVIKRASGVKKRLDAKKKTARKEKFILRLDLMSPIRKQVYYMYE